MNNEQQTQHQLQLQLQLQLQPSERTGGSWRTPDFTVVDTALEVTAYSLRKK